MARVKLYPVNGRKPFILVDMDGTTINIDAPFRETLVEIAPHIKPVVFEDITDYHMERLYPPEAQQYLHQVWITPGLFARAKPFPGAIEALAEMSEGVNMFICSTPRWDNPTCIADKRASIFKYFGREWLENRRLYLVDDKTMIFGQYLIDDKSEIKGARFPFWEHILYDRPWNQHVQGKRRMTWQNWREVLPELT
jgi:5'(3')-deoxyribonucleotidase